MNDSTAESLHSNPSFVLMEEIIQSGKQVVKEVCGKDVVILVGPSGVGKSVLFNYLTNIPMREYSPIEKGIEDSLLDFVIDIVDNNSNAARIGHTTEPMTLIPQITSLTNDLLCCECPSFFGYQESKEIRVAKAVNFRNIVCAARGVKIILLLEYSSLFTKWRTFVRMIDKIVRNLFVSEDGLLQQADSILLGITKIPRDVKKRPFDSLREFIQNSPGTVIRHLCDNLFIFDPLDRDELVFNQVWNREQLIEKIKCLPSISNPSEVFSTSLSNDDCLAFPL